MTASIIRLAQEARHVTLVVRSAYFRTSHRERTADVKSRNARNGFRNGFRNLDEGWDR